MIASFDSRSTGLPPAAPHRFKKGWFLSTIPIILLALSACQPSPVAILSLPPAADPPPNPTALVAVTPTLAEGSQALDSSINLPELWSPLQETAVPLVSPVAPEAQSSPIEPPTSPPVSASTTALPLRFVFPTPGSSPASAWRPPLYPTPWAMTPYDHFYFARPIAADQVNWPLADYRYGGVSFENVVHSGIDIPVPEGTPALAAGPGKVTWTGYGLYKLIPGDLDDPYGLAVAIQHDFGFQGETLYTVYGHLDRIDVARGQRVETGEVVGLTGSTGKTTGPHLHFEVRTEKNNFFASQNPELWLAPPQGWGVLAARVMSTAGLLLPSATFTIQSKQDDRTWTVRSYGDGPANSDPYYRENLVLGDLPAGLYTVLVPYAGSIYNWDIQISPGLVSYFTFQGKNGFKTEPPPPPRVD